MFGIKDCIDICFAIYSVHENVVQNKALCTQLNETVHYCEGILKKQNQQSFSSSSLTEETFQSLHYALSLAQAYHERYTKKKLGRSVIRAWNGNNDRSDFEDCKERIDRCIDRLPVVQIMDQDERFALAEERRVSEFTELKRVINISVEDILSEAHDNNQAVVDIMKEFQQDLHQFVTNEAGPMFKLNVEEISSLRADVDEKLSVLDARQQEILEILRGMYLYIYLYSCILLSYKFMRLIVYNICTYSS